MFKLKSSPCTSWDYETRRYCQPTLQCIAHTSESHLDPYERYDVLPDHLWNLKTKNMDELLEAYNKAIRGLRIPDDERKAVIRNALDHDLNGKVAERIRSQEYQTLTCQKFIDKCFALEKEHFSTKYAKVPDKTPSVANYVPPLLRPCTCPDPEDPDVIDFRCANHPETENGCPTCERQIKFTAHRDQSISDHIHKTVLETFHLDLDNTTMMAFKAALAGNAAPLRETGGTDSKAVCTCCCHPTANTAPAMVEVARLQAEAILALLQRDNPTREAIMVNTACEEETETPSSEIDLVS